MPQPGPANADLERLRALAPALHGRQRLLQAVRQFFAARDFLEVETPIRLPRPALEEFIDAEPAGDWFLRTSPELHMKRLLAAGYPRLVQIGPCFRRGEEGRQHHPEFTMLEWYRANAGCRDILADTVALVRAAAHAVAGAGQWRFRGETINADAPWEELTVDEAFQRHAGLTPEAAMREPAGFEQILVERVEPHLGRGRPTILRDYPLPFAALARPCPGRPDRAERWELYIGGLELANAYGELTDPTEQRRRFLACADFRRHEGRPIYPLDEPFLAALEAGIPPCGGIALGFDRLLMTLLDRPTIADVTAFPPATI
ncbi:MAG: EF-P lysine aminoacylase EpmA [Lentisphaeria bacterium]|jgi:lysyl-tRNA synthetase class 2